MYPLGYTYILVQIQKTDRFARWIDKLQDTQGRALILVRVERLAAGYPGDFKSLGHRVFELRIHYGPGYRVYYTTREKELVILLAGGSRRTQSADIKTAVRLAQNLE